MRHPDRNRIYTLVKGGSLERLTDGDWQTIVVSIIAESTARTFRRENRPVPTWTQSAPDLDVGHLFNWNCVDEGPLEKAVPHFAALPPTVKEALANTLRQMIEEAGKHPIREGQLGHEQQGVIVMGCGRLEDAVRT